MMRSFGLPSGPTRVAPLHRQLADIAHQVLEVMILAVEPRQVRGQRVDRITCASRSLPPRSG